MIQCKSCDRHHRPSEGACPFCGHEVASRRSSPLTTARNVFGGMVTSVVLAACYGGPAVNGTPLPSPDDTAAPVDADADGFVAEDDCDDTDPAINPNATEVCDDQVDNDCDGDVDGADTDCP
jgi:hypothetical protein